jgi:uncharacterized membrane protein YsdA (DUF1294 family)
MRKLESLALFDFRILNFFTIFIFWLDKVMSKLLKRKFIPETALHCLQFMGGSRGSLIAMIVFKHKIKKKFVTRTIIISLLHFLIDLLN